MRGIRLLLILFALSLALVPVAASAHGKSGQNDRNKNQHHGPVFQDGDTRGPFGGFFDRDRHDREERARQAAERHEAIARKLQELRCRVLERHWPEKFERICAGEEPGETNNPPGSEPPDPPETDPPPGDPPPTDPPPPTPTGKANFASIAMVATLRSVSDQIERQFTSGPGDAVPAGMEYGWPGGTFPMSIERVGDISMFTVGGTTFIKTIPATCTWDTLQAAILDGPAGATTELRGVTLNGSALGDLVDNADGVPESDYWTFGGLNLDAGFTLTAQLSVTGWDASSTTPASVEFTVGCGA